MNWKEWSAVVAVVGFGIVMQIPSHDSMPSMDAHVEGRHGEEHLASSAKTMVLEVTGMT